MAQLSFVEQDTFERLFGMSSGYVLDFSNSSFQRFVHSIMAIDVYAKYENMSKAKILRAIIVDYDSVTVGKLLMELLIYQQSKIPITLKEKELFEKCVTIANRLMGKNSVVKLKKETNSKAIHTTFNYSESLKELATLLNIDNNQKRGYAFEKYLNTLFNNNDLEPRGSFKIVGEQIDGSFILHNEVYLIEAKWTNSKTNKSDLVVFNEKVSSKSGFTRGLFISFSGYSEEAIKTFANGRSVNIFLMTVQEIAILLERKIDFKSVLWNKVRMLAEEGNFFKQVIE